MLLNSQSIQFFPNFQKSLFFYLKVFKNKITNVLNLFVKNNFFHTYFLPKKKTKFLSVIFSNKKSIFKKLNKKLGSYTRTSYILPKPLIYLNTPFILKKLFWPLLGTPFKKKKHLLYPNLNLFKKKIKIEELFDDNFSLNFKTKKLKSFLQQLKFFKIFQSKEIIFKKNNPKSSLITNKYFLHNTKKLNAYLFLNFYVFLKNTLNYSILTYLIKVKDTYTAELKQDITLLPQEINYKNWNFNFSSEAKPRVKINFFSNNFSFLFEKHKPYLKRKKKTPNYFLKKIIIRRLFFFKSYKKKFYIPILPFLFVFSECLRFQPKTSFTSRPRPLGNFFFKNRLGFPMFFKYKDLIITFKKNYSFLINLRLTTFIFWRMTRLSISEQYRLARIKLLVKTLGNFFPHVNLFIKLLNSPICITQNIKFKNFFHSHKNTTVLKGFLTDKNFFLQNPIFTSKIKIYTRFKTSFIRNSFFFLIITRFVNKILENKVLNNKTSFFTFLYSFANSSSYKRQIFSYFTTENSYSSLSLDLSNFSKNALYINNNWNTKNFHLNNKIYVNKYLSLNSTFSTTYKTKQRVLKIPRIRFKPGYSRQWRHFRTDVQKVLNIQIRYQYKLTRLLQNLYNKDYLLKFFTKNIGLIPMLVQASLVPDSESAREFLKAGTVFLNGILCFNRTTNLFLNDFLQLVVNIKYYIVVKWLASLTYKTIIRVKRLIKKIHYSRQHQIRSPLVKGLPDWLFKLEYSFYDIPFYIEVDLFTLSFLVIRESFTTNELNVYGNEGLSYKVFNLYNWKYIT